MKTTGERIKSIRLELGETLEQFGERLNTSKATVSNWEKGRNLPNKFRLKELAELGGMTVKELVSAHSVGERIQRIRLENGMSKAEFGKLFEAKGSLVNKWETNQVTPTENRLKEISELGNTTVYQLLNSNPLSDYSTDELLQELERRGSGHETTDK